MSIKYLDFDLLIEHSQDGYKARVLESPAGQATVDFAPPFSEPEIDTFFSQIGQTRSFETEQTRKIQRFGQSLFEAVFTGPVRDRLRLSLGEAAAQNAGLRIRLRLVDTPELSNLPWEFVYDPGQSRFLALSVETPLVRFLETPQTIQPFGVQPPLRILAMICGPKDFPRLDVEREWENLQSSLKDLQDRGLVELTRLAPPTLPVLRRALRRTEYHIFHFVGHGVFSKNDQDGFLLLENELGEGHRLSARDLGTLLHDERSLRLAVLNACEGARAAQTDQFAGTAQTLIQQGIPAVIAMQFRITDKASITLAHEFYGALADGYPVDAALTEARKAIKTEGNDLEWGTPVLYMRSPDGQIFDVAPVILPPAPPVEPRPDRSPAEPESRGSSAGLSIQDSQLAVEPGQQVPLHFTITNDGSSLDHFQVSLSGVPAGWVELPPGPVRLAPGKRAELSIKVQPPRSAQTQSRVYPLTLRVASQEATSRAALAEISLIIQPFSSFTSKLVPETVQAGKTLLVVVQNQGNIDETFTVNPQAPGGQYTFNPAQARLQAGPGQSATAQLEVLPRQRRMFGKQQRDPIQVQVCPEKGDPQLLAGQALSKPISPVLGGIAGAGILLLLALLLMLFIQPKPPDGSVTEVAGITSAPSAEDIVLPVTQPPATDEPTVEPTPEPTGPATEAPVVVPPEAQLGRIVYLCHTAEQEISPQVCIMNGDGSSARPLITDQGFRSSPSLAPDRKSLVFSYRTGETYAIYEMDLESKGLTKLFAQGSALYPEISPDGKSIVFANQVGKYFYIWVMDRDGGNAHEVYTVSKPYAVYPTWSADGSTILFSLQELTGDMHLYTVRPDGTGLQRKNDDFISQGQSDWSADGKLIAGYSGSKGNRKIGIMNADGKNLRYLSLSGSATFPSFSPDSQWLVFVGNLGGLGPGQCGLYRMSVTGEGAPQLLRSEDFCDLQPRWGR
jgi:hypothetical protein